MKTKNILLLIIITIFSISSLNAEYKIYGTQSEFEEAKGSVCEVATDGCNSYFLEDGKVTGGTEMFCSDFTPKWNCTQYKKNIMTTRSLSTTTVDNTGPIACTMEYAPVCGKDGKTYSNRCGAEQAAQVEVDYEGECQEMVICTMEYAPVCGMDGVTYGNKCGAEKGAKVEILHEGQCTDKKELGTNDENFYNTIKDRLDIGYLTVVKKAVYKYEQKINNYSEEKQEELNIAIINKIDDFISQLLLKYPQDIALPTRVNNKYLTFTLLKFEIMKLK